MRFIPSILFNITLGYDGSANWCQRYVLAESYEKAIDKAIAGEVAQGYKKKLFTVTELKTVACDTGSEARLIL